MKCQVIALLVVVAYLAAVVTAQQPDHLVQFQAGSPDHQADLFVEQGESLGARAKRQFGGYYGGRGFGGGYGGRGFGGGYGGRGFGGGGFGNYGGFGGGGFGYGR